MAKRKSARAPLSGAEWAVMNVVWEDGPMAARDIYARLEGERPWGYATVKTLIRRVVAKGWLEYDQVGNSFLYRAAVPRAKAVRRAVREFTNRVLDGAMASFVAYYADDVGLTSEDLDQLEEIIRQHRKGEGD